MNITLYVRKSDDFQQLEDALKTLNLAYILRFKEDYPDNVRRIGATESPLLVVDGRCTFLSSQMSSEELKLLLQACVEPPERTPLSAIDLDVYQD